jgi:hypothetical protein
LLDRAISPAHSIFAISEILKMRIHFMLAALLTADLLVGGCSSYGFLPDTTKLPQPVLSGTDRQDTVKTMQETAQNHGAEAAKKIESSR